jgi:hypothetical protein
VYRILKARGLITTPTHILLAAGNEFSQKTHFVHENVADRFYLLQNLRLGLVLPRVQCVDDYSRFIVHWELCKTMKTEDVQRTINRSLRLQIAQRVPAKVVVRQWSVLHCNGT